MITDSDDESDYEETKGKPARAENSLPSTAVQPSKQTGRTPAKHSKSVTSLQINRLLYNFNEFRVDGSSSIDGKDKKQYKLVAFLVLQFLPPFNSLYMTIFTCCSCCSSRTRSPPALHPLTMWSPISLRCVNDCIITVCNNILLKIGSCYLTVQSDGDQIAGIQISLQLSYICSQQDRFFVALYTSNNSNADDHSSNSAPANDEITIGMARNH